MWVFSKHELRVSQLHLCQRLGDADDRLEDSRRGGDGAPPTSSQVDVGLLDALFGCICQLRIHPTSGKGDVAPDVLRAEGRLGLFLHT